MDTGTLEEILAGAGVTKALELVGPKTLRDTLRCVRKGGTVCNTGILGGVFTLNGFDPIKEIPNGVYFTGFFSNYPDQKTMKDIFLLSAVIKSSRMLERCIPLKKFQRHFGTWSITG